MKMTVGMLRQLFAEMPEDRMFSAKEIAEMLDKFAPLDPDGKLKEMAGKIVNSSLNKL